MFIEIKNNLWMIAEKHADAVNFLNERSRLRIVDRREGVIDSKRNRVGAAAQRRSRRKVLDRLRHRRLVVVRNCVHDEFVGDTIGFDHLAHRDRQVLARLLHVSQVEQAQRRYDQLPALIDVVDGHAEHVLAHLVGPAIDSYDADVRFAAVAVHLSVNGCVHVWKQLDEHRLAAVERGAADDANVCLMNWRTNRLL